MNPITEQSIIEHWGSSPDSVNYVVDQVRANLGLTDSVENLADDDEMREVIVYLAAEVKRLEQELAGKESDQSTSPAPLRRIVINEKSALNGIIVFNAAPSVIAKLQKAECILKLTRSIFEPNRLTATTDPKLFDFDQVVAWMESLA